MRAVNQQQKQKTECVSHYLPLTPFDPFARIITTNSAGFGSFKVLLMAAAVVSYFQQLPPMARCQNCSNRPADGKREPHSHRYKRRAFLCPILMLA
jgi:hypothetical protein